MKKWLSVVHPLLFAVFFVLAFYSANVVEVQLSEIIIPLFAALAFALLALILTSALIGLIRKLQTPNKTSQTYQIWNPRKAAIIASIFIILFFAFGHALRAIGGWDQIHRTIGVPIYWVFISIVWFGLLTISAYFIVKTGRDLGKLNVVLNIIAIVLVIIPTITIIINEIKPTSQSTRIVENIETYSMDSIKTDSFPDIYYIVPDRYASESTLNNIFGFDNSEFLNYLSNKGFFIANESVSNYPYTDSSLLSSLNMDYIHEEAAEGPTSGTIQDYRVWHFLKSSGYKFIHFGSWWERTRENPYADININYFAMPEFSWYLFQTTWAYPWCLITGIVDEWREMQYHRVLYEFDKLAEIPRIKEPTFTFVHMLTPHPPYVFKSDGSYLTVEEARKGNLEVEYIDQLIATNTMLMELIDELLSSSEVPPIIILQSDEGPYPGDEIVWESKMSSSGLEGASEAELRVKYGIFNAYYLPGVNEGVLYPSITPVNSFRLVFNLYFDTDYVLLPDNSYAFYKGYPRQYFDVSDEVKYE